MWACEALLRSVIKSRAGPNVGIIKIDIVTGDRRKIVFDCWKSAAPGQQWCFIFTHNEESHSLLKETSMNIPTRPVTTQHISQQTISGNKDNWKEDTLFNTSWTQGLETTYTFFYRYHN